MTGSRNYGGSIINQRFCFIWNMAPRIYDNIYIIHAAFVITFITGILMICLFSYLLKWNGSWYNTTTFIWNPLSSGILHGWRHGSWVPASVLWMGANVQCHQPLHNKQSMRGENLCIINRWSDKKQEQYQICAHILCMKVLILEEKL